MLLNIYGLLSACFFVLMDAVDVAFTEAAVGLGVSTILLLSTLTITGIFEKNKRIKPIFTFVIVIISGFLLIYGTLQMPPFGSSDAPIHQHVATYYIEESYTETGIPNIVTSVLANYRGYDTLGELFVIFAAGIGVITLLDVNTNIKNLSMFKNDLSKSLIQNHILRVISKMLIPLILLFALYVQFHGDFGPGGGFQGGVIFASAFILYTMLFGLKASQKLISQSWLEFFSALGVLLYTCIGMIPLFTGKSFLNYKVLAQDPLQGQHLGVLIVELGVGITVFSIILLIFIAFTKQVSIIGEGK